MVVAAPLKTTHIQVFSAGKKRDRIGRVREWTVAELQEAADSYNPELKRADVLVGHDSMESKGWIAKVYLEGKKLFCDYGNVDPEFAEEVNAGHYKKRSISFWPPDHDENPTSGKWYVRHLAYVALPAEKGMPDHQFEEESDEVFWEFAGGFMGITIPILRKGAKREDGSIWGDAEISQLLSSYQPEHHEAPILIEGGGEHKAYGWVKGITAEDGIATALVEPITPQFKESLEKEDYQERVIQLYEPDNPNNPTPGQWNLCKLVFKGVADFGEGQELEFSEPEGLVSHTEFSEKTLNYAEIGWRAFNAMGAIASLLSRQRDRAIESGGLDSADQDYPQALIDLILKEGDASYITFNDFQQLLDSRDRELSMLQNRLWSLEDKVSGFINGNNSLQMGGLAYAEEGGKVKELEQIHARLQEIEQRQTREASDREKRDAADFVEGLVRTYQIRASDKEGWVQQVLAAPNSEATISFGEESLTPREALKRQLQSLPKFFDNRRLSPGTNTIGQMDGAEYAEAEGVNPDSTQDDRAIRSIMREQSCSYSEAYTEARSRGVIKSL